MEFTDRSTERSGFEFGRSEDKDGQSFHRFNNENSCLIGPFYVTQEI